MRSLVFFLFLMIQPFWESKTPQQWTEQELEAVRHDSPWAQSIGPMPKVLVYLATAAPISEAEGELRLRAKDALDEPEADYIDFLRENWQKDFVLAIPYGKRRLGPPAEEKRMEDETVMMVGRKKYKMIGHFPPTTEDPVLRLVFPREVLESDKAVSFQLYLPGVVFPARDVEFKVKDLMYRGKLAM